MMSTPSTAACDAPVQATAARTEPAEPAALIDHILARYHQVHRQQLPTLLGLAAKVEAVHADHAEAPRGLTTLLQSMQAELLEHMDKEECILFPMLVQGGNPFVVHPIGVMRAEHDDHAVQLARLLALTHDATPPAGACATWRQLYAGVRTFADDLQHHIHLENDLLFPQFTAPAR